MFQTKPETFERKRSIFLPLRLPVDEAERGVKKQPHFSQRPLSVDAEEEVWGGGVLEGHIHQLSRPKKTKKHQIQSSNYDTTDRL